MPTWKLTAQEWTASQLPPRVLYSSSSLLQNPGSHSDFHQSKSGSFFRAKPAWRLLLFKETTLGLKGRDFEHNRRPIRSCRLAMARPRPWSRALKVYECAYCAQGLPRYVPLCAPCAGALLFTPLLLGKTSSLPLGSQSSCTCPWLRSKQSKGLFRSLEPANSQIPFPIGMKW